MWLCACVLVVMSSSCFFPLLPNSDIYLQEDSGLDQLTLGLATLDITQATSANQIPVSTEVGGARQKVFPQKSLSETEVKPPPPQVEYSLQQVTAEDSQSAARRVEDSQSKAAVGVAGAEPEEEGACGWLRPRINLEIDGGEGRVRTTTRLYQTVSDTPGPY